uniref:Eukaryotic translation initiation factor 5 n=1 Tax=Rhinolophus ferrumequinum TaxID=59479 RepID=A0A671DU14_RHIFE
MFVNVNCSASGQFYHYKMASMITKVEGKGNGIKTVIVNMVAKALNRLPTYPTKYFGCELGAKTQFDNDHYIVNESHKANKLQGMLDGFIKKFVLYPECENPETELHVNPKKQKIGNSCKEMLDMHWKLCTFTLKNPSENNDSGAGKKEKEKKSRTGKDKENGSMFSSETVPPSPPNEISPPHAVGEEEDGEWGKSTTEEAQRYLTFSDDLERTVKEWVNIPHHFLQFCQCVVVMHPVQFISNSLHILKEMYDTDLLEEEVISWSEKASKKYVSKELDKEIRVKAEPFIKWLKEAKEESSGSGDDEDKNIEMMYSKTASVPKVEAAKSDNKDDDIDLMPFKGKLLDAETVKRSSAECKPKLICNTCVSH